MRVNRFQLALYIGYPLIASVSSVLMILHYLIWLDGAVDESHPLAAALIYYDMAENLSFFNESLFSHRVIIPALVGLIGNGIGITGEGAYGIIFGALNFVVFIAGCGIMFRIALLNQRIGAFQIILPTIFLVLMPAYLEGLFFPMTDAGAFFAVAAILFALFFRQLWLLYLAAVLGVFVQEMVLFTIAAVPLINYIRNDSWNEAYFPFIVSGLMYTISAMAFAPSLANHYMFTPGLWPEMIESNIAEWWPGIIWYFLIGFGPALIYIVYKFISNGFQLLYLGSSGILVFLFLILMLFTPEGLPRYLFAAMPLLILFAYTDDQFREVFKWVMDPSSRPVENRPGDDEASRESGLGGYTDINLN